MTDHLKPYSEYKNSRQPWLVKIPSHWDERRAKYFFKETDERSETGNEELLSVSHITGVTPRSQKNITMFMAEKNTGYKKCREGDLVINTMWAWMAALGIAKQSGIVSPSYAVYRPISSSDFVNDYVDHLLRTEAFQAEYVCRSTGIRGSRLRLYPEKFLIIPICYPPYKEQQHIADYLSEKNRQIRQYIRTKLQLISLLNEQKRAIISNAVTRGLDENVRLKPSGIDSLGEIPAHWNEVPIKQASDVRLSGVDKHVIVYEKPIRLCNYKNVYDHDFITQDMDFTIGTATDVEIKYLSIRKNDVLITKDSEMWNDIAVPSLVSDDFDDVLCGYHLALIRPDIRQLKGEFLMRVLCSPIIACQFHCTANGVTRYGLSKHDIKTAIIPLPSLEEQQSIINYLQGPLKVIEESIDFTQKQIKFMREYQIRLISDIVAGKVDVRDQSDGLPVFSESEVEK